MKAKVWQYTCLNPKGIGGVESHIFHVSHELQKLGHEVFVGLNPPESFLAGISENLPLIIHTHGETIPNQEFLKLKSKIKYAKHVHVSHGTTFGRTCKTLEFHKISSYRGAWKDFISIHRADAVVCVSQAALNETRRLYFSKKISKVIPNGVDEKIFYPVHEITNNPSALFVGRASDKVKNLNILLKAFDAVSHQNSAASLRIVSEESPESIGNIQKTGPKFGADLAEMYRMSKVLVIPSFYEGDSIVAREASAVGVAVLAVDLPVLRENLQGYQASQFFKFNNFNDLAAKLSSMLFSKNLPPSPKIRSWIRVAQEFEEFYKELNY